MPMNVPAELPPVTASLSSLKLALNKLPTVAPLIELTFASSAIAVSVTFCLPETTVGASLSASTYALTWMAVSEVKPSASWALTLNAFKLSPLASGAAFHRSWSLPATVVVPATTSSQRPSSIFNFCNVPVVTSVIRNLTESPTSTSLSLAAFHK